jgi:hypothetical protein
MLKLENKKLEDAKPTWTQGKMQAQCVSYFFLTLTAATRYEDQAQESAPT